MDAVFRRRIMHHGRITKRVDCPKEGLERRTKNISTDKCGDCDFAVEVTEKGVLCSFHQSR